MQANEIKEYFKTVPNWSEDRFGNFKKQTPNKLYRLKFQANSVRLEVQATLSATEYSKESNFWVKLDGAYLKDVCMKDCKLKIGKYLFKGE